MVAPELSSPVTRDRIFNVADSSSAVAADVTNLFARFGSGAVEGAIRYREIHSDADADNVAARWPLLAEWLATRPLTGSRG